MGTRFPVWKALAGGHAIIQDLVKPSKLPQAIKKPALDPELHWLSTDFRSERIEVTMWDKEAKS